MCLIVTRGAQMSTQATTAEDERVRVLAQALDCLTESDICALYGITPVTAESWRKRRKGPGYVLAGTRFLYPRKCVAADLQSRERAVDHGHAAVRETL